MHALVHRRGTTFHFRVLCISFELFFLTNDHHMYVCETKKNKIVGNSLRFDSTRCSPLTLSLSVFFSISIVLERKLECGLSMKCAWILFAFFSRTSCTLPSLSLSLFIMMNFETSSKHNNSSSTTTTTTTFFLLLLLLLLLLIPSLQSKHILYRIKKIQKKLP